MLRNLGKKEGHSNDVTNHKPKQTNKNKITNDRSHNKIMHTKIGSQHTLNSNPSICEDKELWEHWEKKIKDRLKPTAVSEEIIWEEKASVVQIL